MPTGDTLCIGQRRPFVLTTHPLETSGLSTPALRISGDVHFLHGKAEASFRQARDAANTVAKGASGRDRRSGQLR
jgi:hypothetical protein